MNRRLMLMIALIGLAVIEDLELGGRPIRDVARGRF